MESNTYIGRFLQQAAFTPADVAVADGCGSLSYAALARRSGALAALLRRRGLGDGEMTGVLLPRTLDIVVAALAVMRAGGVYVPMDPAYPEDRLRYMLSDCGAGTVITTRELLGEKFTSDAPEAVFIEETEFGGAPFDAPLSPDRASYLLYTSGTTGRPKGVLHTQRSLLAMASQKHPCGYDATGVAAGFTFIASAFMIFPPLICGGHCDIIPEKSKSDMYSLHEYVTAKGIHQLFLPASLAATMAEEFDLDGVTIFSAGEKLRSFTPRGDCRIINTYGSTEGGGVLGWTVSGGETDIPLGVPYEGITARIVSDNGSGLLADVPQGEAGELIYTGDIMAQKYLNLDEQTAAKWITEGGVRWYRTGDRMRMDERGRYHYLGRTDNMVKIRGFRVETGEVENSIREAEPLIRDTVVVLRTIHGIDHLCCYYTSSAEVDTSALKESIARTLAEYMIPDVWTALEDFPRNANGKVLRAALPEPKLHSDTLSALYSEVEMRVEEAARTVLGIDSPVDIDDSFLDLGGDSLRAMKLSATLREQGIRISGSQILRIKILRDIAAEAEVAYERFWTAGQYEQVRRRFALRGETIQKVLPLSDRQDDMLYGELFYPDSTDNRRIYVLGINSEIGGGELSEAVGRVSGEIEALRAAVVCRGVSVFQQVITDRTVPCSTVQLGGSSEDAFISLAQLCKRLKGAPSDPETSPAMEVVFARGGSKGGCLIFKVMHLSLDLADARMAIAGILRNLTANHPEDALLADWLSIMEDANQSGEVKNRAPRRRITSRSYDEVAVYSDHPGLKNLVFVHTGNTGSDAYYALADRIGGACSFSVIEPYNLYNPAQAIDGIRGIAAKYVEILQRRQPHGPYLLGGWCYGGVVAHEMACQLQARGEKVERLIMLDSHAVTDPLSRQLFTGMTSRTGRDYFETSPLFADLRDQGLLESVVANSQRVARDLAAHEPAFFDGPVTYFKPRVTPAGLEGESLRYWQEMMKHEAGGYELFCSEIDVIPTPHEHDLMMDDESLETIVPEIMKYIKI